MKTFKIAFFALLFMMTGAVSAAPLMVTDVDGVFSAEGVLGTSGSILNFGNETHINSGTLNNSAVMHTFEIANTGTSTFRLWLDGTASSSSNISGFSVKVAGFEVASITAGAVAYNIGLFNSLLLAATDTVTMVVTGNFSNASYGMTLATPIPAAVWLFGSALMGLFGASRRKSTAVAA